MIPPSIQSFLDKRGIRFRAAEHEPRPTSQEIAATSHISGKHFAKTVVLKTGHGEFLLAVVPATEHLNLQRLSEWIGRGVELAGEQEFAAMFPDCEVGAMPPFGELYNLPVLVDGCLARSGKLAMSAGTHRDMIEMSWDDFRSVANARVIEHSALWH